MLKATWYRTIADIVTDEKIIVTDGVRTQTVHIWTGKDGMKRGEIRNSTGKVCRNWATVRKAYETYKPLAGIPINTYKEA